MLVNCKLFYKHKQVLLMLVFRNSDPSTAKTSGILETDFYNFPFGKYIWKDSCTASGGNPGDGVGVKAGRAKMT